MEETANFPLPLPILNIINLFNFCQFYGQTKWDPVLICIPLITTEDEHFVFPFLLKLPAYMFCPLDLSFSY